MNKIFALIFSVALLMQAAIAQQTGSWGDQGNGIYKNPILESNYPDNDVMRMGDTFYMMSSTNHFAPGMVILKSKDLINWQFSNCIMPAPITFDQDYNIEQGDPDMLSKGCWAGSFGYNGHYYFAYWCFNKRFKKGGSLHIVHSQAKSMEGPWSEPRELTWPDGKPIDSTDPGVLWDMDTKKAWIACCNDHIYEMSWDGDKLLQNKDQGIVAAGAHSPDESAELPKFEGMTYSPDESAKLYKFDGMYYYMNTHVTKTGNTPREQIFSRAKSIEGPWEGRVVLENGNGTDRCPTQGSLLKLDDGSWWFIHQLARGTPEERYDGRPQFVEPVVWKDGWPLIGDTSGDGIGKVIWEHQKPISGFPVTAPASDDDFSKPVLGLQWSWRFNPRMDRWSLTERPGFLRLKSCVPVRQEADKESIKFLPNLIGQRLMGHHNNVMTAKFDFSGMANGEEGGLHISAYDSNIIGVKKDDQGKMHLFFKSDANKHMVVQPGITLTQTDVWLQAKVENGLATFFYSLDGKNFTQLGGDVRLLFSTFTANMVGFYTMNTVEKGYMDVDWFKYDYDGPKGAESPSVTKL